MFIISLTYKAELTKVDQFIQEHIEYLDQQYAQGNFLLSGPKEPRVCLSFKYKLRNDQKAINQGARIVV